MWRFCFSCSIPPPRPPPPPPPSLTKHHLHNINTTAPARQHHQDNTTINTTPATRHHLHNIFNTTPSTLHHQKISKTTSSTQHLHNNLNTTPSTLHHQKQHHQHFIMEHLSLILRGRCSTRGTSREVRGSLATIEYCGRRLRLSGRRSTWSTSVSFCVAGAARGAHPERLRLILDGRCSTWIHLQKGPRKSGDD